MVATHEAKTALTNIHCRGVLPNGRPCNRLLFRIEAFRVGLEIKCPKCGRMEYFGPVE